MCVTSQKAGGRKARTNEDTAEWPFERDFKLYRLVAVLSSVYLLSGIYLLHHSRL